MAGRITLALGLMSAPLGKLRSAAGAEYLSVEDVASIIDVLRGFGTLLEEIEALQAK
jgi:hypothetical protein